MQNIIILIITIGLALIMLWFGSKITVNWVKKSFIIYALLFTITAFFIGGFSLYENRYSLKQAFETKKYVPVKTELSQYVIKSSVKIDAPMIYQLPELPRGCEVTSLAMLLQYHGEEVDKMELAEKVEKDPTPYEVKDNKIHFGNPHLGFVGDMYSFQNPGYGVYHKPIAELARNYVGDRVQNFSGGSFSEIIDHLNEDRPVWVIINSRYKQLPESQFTTWHTPSGPIKITMREHSVLITGYDEQYIYFNDPLNLQTKAPYEEFKAAWLQMGKQAITIL